MAVAGGLAAAVAAFQVTRRFGGWVGLMVPAAVALAWVGRAAMPLGHAEEAVGRGLEQIMVWLPLTGLTLVCWLAGLFARKG